MSVPLRTTQPYVPGLILTFPKISPQHIVALVAAISIQVAPSLSELFARIAGLRSATFNVKLGECWISPDPLRDGATQLGQAATCMTHRHLMLAEFLSVEHEDRLVAADGDRLGAARPKARCKEVRRDR